MKNKEEPLFCQGSQGTLCRPSRLSLSPVPQLSKMPCPQHSTGIQGVLRSQR